MQRILRQTMSQDTSTFVTFRGKRARFESIRPFDDVAVDLRRLVPKTIPPDSYPAAMEKEGGLNLAMFEKVVQTQVGESGFMLFAEFNYGMWLPLYQIHRKVSRFILGNPVIAITMMRHDIEAGLFAPVELLLLEGEQGDGSTIIYDVPSSLMVIRENRPLEAAAVVLDAKLEALVRRVMEGRPTVS